MGREQLRDDVPQLWRDRIKIGICPVCTKEKSQFEKNRRIYCSEKCCDEFSSKFTSWSGLKDVILKRDNHTCGLCGETPEKKDKEYGEYRKDAIKKWIESNKEVIKYYRSKALVDLEERFREEFNRLMDDDYVLKNEVPYDRRWDDFSIKKNTFRLEVDHIIPIGLDGDVWDENNLQTLCYDCHKKKTVKDMVKMANERKIKKLKKGNE